MFIHIRNKKSEAFLQMACIRLIIICSNSYKIHILQYVETKTWVLFNMCDKVINFIGLPKDMKKRGERPPRFIYLYDIVVDPA